MKKTVCALLAAVLLSGGVALAHEQDAVDPVLAVVAAHEDADDQIEALLELRARVDAMIAQIGSGDYAPLERNDISEAVTRLQERLAELGYLTTRINGKYDNETVKAVKQFEKVNGLDNDGKASVLDQLILFSDSALNKDGERLIAQPAEDGPAAPGADEPEAEPAKPGADEPEAEPAKPGADGPETEPAKPGADEPETEPAKPGADISAEYAPFDSAEYAADPEAYEGRAVLLEGRVVQLLTAQDDVGALVLLLDDMQRVYVELDARLLADMSGGDSLAICARIEGTYDYTTLQGGARTLPRAVADSVESLG